MARSSTLTAFCLTARSLRTADRLAGADGSLVSLDGSPDGSLELLTDNSLVVRVLGGSCDTCPTVPSFRSADRSTWAQWFLRFARRFVDSLTDLLLVC
jgi:hypothetical protein